MKTGCMGLEVSPGLPEALWEQEGPVRDGVGRAGSPSPMPTPELPGGGFY